MVRALYTHGPIQFENRTQTQFKTGFNYYSKSNEMKKEEKAEYIDLFQCFDSFTNDNRMEQGTNCSVKDDCSIGLTDR